MISYEPFWNMCSERNISTYILRNEYFISASTLTRMRNNESISLESVDKLCEVFDCNIDDIVIHIPDKKPTPTKKKPKKTK